MMRSPMRAARWLLPSYAVNVPETVDVAKLRHRLGLSQAAFARTFGLDVTALQAWEQGRRRPGSRGTCLARCHRQGAAGGVPLTKVSL